ncbi:ABC transporter ATP-binding protein [Alicyclobacillus fodiniaquatilis]|uniref:ABC transporter ATP-binding protein n=1 Tax=Alicyclobacillus fodiniaquatilis TaxID=1661150 RepID=A0ABW4JDB6_9BACL
MGLALRNFFSGEKDTVDRPASLKQMWTPFLRIMPYMWKVRGAYFALVIIMFINLFVSLYIAWFLQTLTEAAIHQDLGKLHWMLPVGIAVVVVCTSFVFAQNYLQGVVVCKIEQDVRMDLYQRTLRMKTDRMEAHQSGDILSRMTYDIGAIGAAVGVYVLNVARLMLTAIGALIYLLFLNWQLTLICICLAPPAIFAAFLFSKYAKRNSKKLSEAFGSIQSFVNESLSGLMVIRTFTLENQFIRQFHERTGHLLHLQIKNIKLRSGVSSGMSLAHYVAYLLSFTLGAFYVAHGAMTVGGLLAFMTLMQNVIGPMMSTPREFGSFQTAMAAVERIWGIMDEEMEDHPPQPMLAFPSVPQRTVIDFHQVSYTYANGSRALEQVSFSVPMGSTVALVGPSGAGKSTLFKLLLGLYEPTSGVITLNGQSIQARYAQVLRQQIAYVPQETFLFSGTIRDNIRQGAFAATDEEIVQAAIDANAHDFIASLPHGYDTEVGERAMRLSGGQRQRIAIARALLKDAPILLLDEATSALDTQSEQVIQEALHRLMKGRTTLSIAHRLSTVIHADYVYVLDKGHVVEQGTHESLFKNGQLYAELYRAQFQGARHAFPAPAFHR